MPDTILVEHAVGVVHPPPLRCVVIGGTVFFHVAVIEFVSIGHLLPAAIAVDVASGPGTAVEGDVKQFVITGLVWYVVVHLVYSQLTIQRFDQLVVLDDTDMRILLTLLHR